MQSALRVSEAVAIGVHAVVALALAKDGEKLSGHGLSAGMKASEAHLLKVMRRLVKAGLVASERGPSGGFALAKKSKEISLLDIYEAIEGSFPGGDCLFGTPVCGGKNCPLGGFLHSINKQAMDYFARTTIATLAKRTRKGGRA